MYFNQFYTKTMYRIKLISVNMMIKYYIWLIVNKALFQRIKHNLNLFFTFISNHYWRSIFKRDPPAVDLSFIEDPKICCETPKLCSLKTPIFSKELKPYEILWASLIK